MSQKTASDSLSVSVLVSMCVCVSLVIMLSLLLSVYVTVTVTEALVLRLLLEDRGRITESNTYPGARRQNETEMFSGHDESSPSIAAVLAPSVAYSMLAVQQ